VLTPIRRPAAQNADLYQRAVDVARQYRFASRTVVMQADVTTGGGVLTMRVSDGQKVKKDDIVAVLSNYSRADSDRADDRGRTHQGENANSRR